MTSTMKEAVIRAFNEAIQRYAEKGGKVYPGDVVVDYFPENARVANFTYRHPGAYLVPVKLKEGSGFIFLTGIVENGNVFPRIAWEEDNELRRPSYCYTDGDKVLEGYGPVKELLKELMMQW